MFIVIYTIFLMLSSAALFLLGFMIGRSARKLPIDDTIPWTVNWVDRDPRSQEMPTTRRHGHGRTPDRP